LKEANPIDSAVQRWRGQLTGEGQDRSLGSKAVSVRSSSDRGESPPETLRRLLWNKIEPHLSGCHTVIVLPAGELTRIPWAALPGRESDQFLIEEYAIATAAYGQQLFGLLADLPIEGDRLLLAGGINYDDRNIPAEPNSPGKKPTVIATGRSVVEVRGMNLEWEFLDGAQKETEIIRQTWGDRGSLSALSGRDATESALAEMLTKSNFAHLATHGFFAAPGVRSFFEVDLRDQSLFQISSPEVRSTLGGRNPLLLSGLVVSGANAAPVRDEFGIATEEDGILTAEEIAGLDLSGIKLVTLSACETALGDVAAGEGVFGLQRAFHQAGARSVVASLWKVSDAATQALMTEFYKNLWQKRMGKLESLRQAQLKMIRDYDPMTGQIRGLGTKSVKVASTDAPTSTKRLHPNFWAAFQLSGDWR
jgi:CHAT domain-containing protein